MHIGVVVGGFQARQTDQHVAAALHRRGDIVDQCVGLRRRQGLAPAHLVEHRLHGLARVLDQAPGVRQFLVARAGRNRAVIGCGCGHGIVDWRRHSSGGCACRSRFRQRQPTRRIDPHFAQACRADTLQVSGRLEQEGTRPERVIEPGTAQALDRHSQHQFATRYFFQQGGSPDIQIAAFTCALEISYVKNND
jgi:hypothetical protein